MVFEYNSFLCHISDSMTWNHPTTRSNDVTRTNTQTAKRAIYRRVKVYSLSFKLEQLQQGSSPLNHSNLFLIFLDLRFAANSSCEKAILLALSSSFSWFSSNYWGPFLDCVMNFVISTVRVTRDFVSFISSVVMTKSLTLNGSGIAFLRLWIFLLRVSSESSRVETSRITYFSSYTSITSTLKSFKVDSC